ncbi:MAG: hypothetical protein ACK58T_50660, partial [Phycisphaerae bacterium]
HGAACSGHLPPGYTPDLRQHYTLLLILITHIALRRSTISLVHRIDGRRNIESALGTPRRRRETSSWKATMWTRRTWKPIAVAMPSISKPGTRGLQRTNSSAYERHS